MTGSHATSEGTKSFFATRDVHPDKLRNFQNLTLSALGIGTYLGDSDDLTDQFYHRAIFSAVSHGVNIFDTASNYRSQRSEKLIARALKDLEGTGVTRDQIVLSTKGGYIASPEEEDFESYIRSHYVEKGIVKSNELIDGSHSLSPAFLEHELEKSLQRLNVSSIDLYYLHNPEIHLQEISESAFEERMHQAFEFLEKMVKANKIQTYGLATWNGFRLKTEAKCHLSLSKLLKLAKKIAGENHHFKAIQLPYNLVMLEAHKVINQQISDDEDDKLSILKAAHKNKITVFTSAPLMQAQLLNLPRRIFDNLPPQISPMQKALQFVTSTPFVTSSMVGMKTVSHVHENLRILQEPNWTFEQMKAAYKLLGI